jgi:hypothetical protein
MILEHEGIDLLLQEPHVCGEGEHVLDRAVVEIEAEPHESPFRCRDERSLPRARVLEEVLSLDHRTQGGCGLVEERVGDLRIDGAGTSDDGRVRLREARNRSGAELGAAEERETRSAAEDGLRLGAHASARLSVAAEGEDAVDTARGPVPEGYLREHVEAEEQRELDLGGEERRELQQSRMAGGLAVEDVAGGRERQRTGLRDCGGGSANVGFVELERGGELDQRGRRVPGGGEIVSDLGVGAPFANAAGARENTLERRADVLRTALEEVVVNAFEPFGRAGDTGTIRLERPRERERSS